MRLLVLVLCVGITHSASLSVEDNAILDKSLEMMGDDEDFIPLGLPLLKPLRMKEPCCAPKQWEGIIGERVDYTVKGQGESGENIQSGYVGLAGKMAVDGGSKRVAMEIVMRETQMPAPTNLTIIVDLSTHQMYIADMVKKSCRKVPCGAQCIMGPQCLPSKSQYKGSVRFGAGNKNSMDVDVWQAQVLQDQMRMKLLLLVTPDLCVPVVESGFGVGGGVSTKIKASFMNVNTKISDPSIFTPPSFCDQAEEFSIGSAMAEPIVASLLKRFSQ